MDIPNHIAIIPDGNRRWARERKMPTIEGHRKGFDNVVSLGRKTRQLGITTLTFWAFSTENWQRTKEEVDYLMNLYEKMITRYIKEAIKDEVCIVHMGRKDRLPQSLLSKIQNAEHKTRHYRKHYLNIAIDYGGRDEIIRAVNKTRKTESETENISEADINQNLDLADQPYPNPDIIIRTGKEYRLSGFMLWQSQYSELFFPDVYFPDFTPNQLADIIEEYGQKQRRFGK